MSLVGKKICINEDWVIGESIGVSNFYVHEIRDTNLLVKVMEVRGWIDDKYIANEARFYKAASDLAVAPKFIDGIFCEYDEKRYGLLIFERYGEGSLTELYQTDYYNLHESEIKGQLRSILDTLYDNNIDHNDLHSNNFLYRFLDDGEIEIRIIDFDTSRELGTLKRNYSIEVLDTSDYIELSTKRQRK